MTDDGDVLVLASNLNSFDGEVHTTIDNRIISNKNAQILFNGKEITEDTMIDNPKNISINFKGNYKGENIGYKIISAPQLTIKKVDREGTWKEIGGKLTDTIKKTYFTAYINHGENPRKDKFAYVLLPMFSKDEVNNYDTSRFEIIKLDDEAHIVKDKKSRTLGINFWKDVPTKEPGIKTYAALSVHHGENPRKDEFAYVLLPMFNKDEVNSYDTSRFEIIKLDDEAQIVKDKKSGILGINFWKDVPMKEQGIKTYAALSVLVKENKEFIDLWVSEPTQLSKYNSIFEIDGNYELVKSSTEDIKTSLKENKLRVEINLRNNGSTEHIRLKKI